ncbi:MAG TPA: 16S rRNA (cytidine(1402)-2'-O)-methyltransferase [Firmicutes bacterium]|nr:16S rRNA (cytidine(1402)-2'-O)-methyltransferase [Bacillota bacterium]
MAGKNREKTANGGAPGTFFFCATPIGNLRDITLRVLDCLKTVDYIAVENASRSRKLLYHYGIRVPLLSYREAGREKKERLIIELLQKGASIALLSDAGMPSVSDPGSSLAHRLQQEDIPFTVLPGPSAALAALLHSGYAARRFVFWGFLSRRKKERRWELEQVAAEEKTGIIYEAPHRLGATLAELSALLGERELVVCRELTKQFEEIHRGSAQRLQEHFLREEPRGEITIVVSPLRPLREKATAHADAGGKKEDGEKMEGVLAKLQQSLEEGIPPSQAVKNIARRCNLSRRKVYDLLLKLQGRK